MICQCHFYGENHIHALQQKVSVYVHVRPSHFPPQQQEQNLYSGAFILPTTPMGSARTSLGPKSKSTSGLAKLAIPSSVWLGNCFTDFMQQQQQQQQISKDEFK